MAAPSAVPSSRCGYPSERRKEDDMAEWIGTTWRTAGFVAVSTAAIFGATLIGIHVAGRRTVAQMSAFDFIVTVAIGTLVSSTALSPDPSLLAGLAALATLLALQLAIAWGRRRLRWLRRLVDLSPVILAREGRAVERGMAVPHLTRDDLLERLRQHGVYSLDAVELVVLEPTGEITVVRDRAALREEGIQLLRERAKNPEAAELPEP
jgi:uncharacterized membrane protein YcaP (DUF421 family)